MSIFPKDYQFIKESHSTYERVRMNKTLNDLKASIETSIKNKLPSDSNTHQLIIATLETTLGLASKLYIFKQYAFELLTRLDAHLSAKNEDKANTEQLSLLLEQKTGYIFDRDIMKAFLYGTGIAILVAIALVAAAGAVMLTMASPPMSMVVLPIFVMIAIGILIENPEYKDEKLQAIMGAVLFSGFMLYTMPGLFLYTAGLYLAAFSTLIGVTCGIKHCVEETSATIDTYKFRSSLEHNAEILKSSGLFATHQKQEEEQDDSFLTSELTQQSL